MFLRILFYFQIIKNFILFKRNIIWLFLVYVIILWIKSCKINANIDRRPILPLYILVTSNNQIAALMFSKYHKFYISVLVFVWLLIIFTASFNLAYHFCWPFHSNSYFSFIFDSVSKSYFIHVYRIALKNSFFFNGWMKLYIFLFRKIKSHSTK